MAVKGGEEAGLPRPTWGLWDVLFAAPTWRHIRRLPSIPFPASSHHALLRLDTKDDGMWIQMAGRLLLPQVFPAPSRHLKSVSGGPQRSHPYLKGQAFNLKLHQESLLVYGRQHSVLTEADFEPTADDEFNEFPSDRGHN